MPCYLPTNKLARLENSNRMQLAMFKIKQATIDNRQQATMANQGLVQVTLRVVYVVQTVCIRAKVCRSKPITSSRSTRPKKPSKGKHLLDLWILKTPLVVKLQPRLVLKVTIVKSTSLILAHRNRTPPNLSFKSGFWTHQSAL